MDQRVRVTVDPAFSVEIREGWEAEADEDEGVIIAGPSGVGLLHMVAFPQPGEIITDPAEELYAFLDDQGIQLEEDEVEDVELAGGEELSMCEYVAEEEDDQEESETTFWLVGVATAPGTLVFSSYTCPAADAEKERDAIREILTSLRLSGLA